MLKFIKFYFKNFSMEVLLLGFAVTMLLIFTLIVLSPDNTLWVGEPSNSILYFEVCFCLFSICWAGHSIIKKIKIRR